MASSHRPSGTAAMDELKLSGEEVKSFEKAFKDPEFVKMFGEYAKEINDPANKAETEMYLRQLERQGEIENVYGKGTQLIIPTPEFVFKTKDKKDGLKVFVNMCSSDKVGEPELVTKPDTKGARGQHLNLPLAGSSARREAQDKNGNKSWVYDVTMHPEAFQMLHKHSNMLQAMVESAIEHIEKANSVKLGRQFSRPKLKFKGTPGHEQKPAVTAIRGEATAKTADGHIKPHSKATSSAAALLPQPPASSVDAAGDVSTPRPHGKRSPFSPRFPNGAVPRQKTSRDPGFQHPNGEVTPQYTLVHQGNRDLTEAWNDPTGQPCKGVPCALIVRITLPGIVSAAAVQLDVTATRITAAVPGKYLLELPLPFCISSDGSAQFDRDASVLTLNLPVSGHKAGSSNEQAATGRAAGPHQLPPCSQDPTALDPAREGCERQGAGPGHTAGSARCLVQVLGDVPDCAADADQVLPDTAGSRDGEDTCGTEANAGTAEQCGIDEAGAAATESPGVQRHPCIEGEADIGRTAVLEEAAGSAPVHVQENGQRESGTCVQEDVVSAAEDVCPVPLSHDAPAGHRQQPACTEGSVGSTIEGSAVGEALKRTPQPSVSGTDGQSCAESLADALEPARADVAGGAGAAMQAVQAARSGTVSADEVDLKALAAAWSIANASLDSKQTDLGRGTALRGDESSGAGQEPASSCPVQDAQQRDAESDGDGDSEAERISASDAASLEQGWPRGIVQPGVPPGTGLCLQQTDGWKEVGLEGAGGLAGQSSPPQFRQSQDKEASERLPSSDSAVCAQANRGEEGEPVQAVKLAMALDLPMLNELD